MKRLGLLTVSIFATLAVCAFAMTSMAAALPEISLPSGTWKGKNDGSGATAKPTLETLKLAKIVCNKAEGKGADTSNTLGTFTIDFEECEEPKNKVKCSTSGDSTGIILTDGTYHYVWDSLTTLGIAVLFLPLEVTIECTALVKIKVKQQSANGGLVCLILEPTSSKVTHLLHCEQELGDQKEKTYWNDSGTAITNAELLCSTNGAAFETCAELALAEVNNTFSVSWSNV